jgi:hypothetical protein
MKGSAAVWVGLSALLWIAVGVAGTAVYRELDSGPSLGEHVKKVEESFTVLGLNEAQCQRLAEIIADYREGALEIHRTSETRLRELARDADAQIEALLTEEQRAKYWSMSLGAETS